MNGYEEGEYYICSVCPSLLLGITGLQEEYRSDDGICGGFRTSLLSVDCGTGAKNIGYVQHVIRIYGNIHPNGMVKLVFDVNVVPHADYTRDYEELYKEEVERSALVRGLVDGDESEKGYYVDDVSRDSRESPRYPWRGEE